MLFISYLFCCAKSKILLLAHFVTCDLGGWLGLNCLGGSNLAKKEISALLASEWSGFLGLFFYSLGVWEKVVDITLQLLFVVDCFRTTTFFAEIFCKINFLRNLFCRKFLRKKLLL